MNETDKLTVEELIKHANLRLLYPGRILDSDIDNNVKKWRNIDLQTREISVIGINRGGLELTGFEPPVEERKKRILVLSKKESEYLNYVKLKVRNNQKVVLEKIKNIFKWSNIPAIIVTKNFCAGNNECVHSNIVKNNSKKFFCYTKMLTNMAKELNSEIPILYFSGNTNDMHTKITSYIAERLAERIEIHANLVNIYGYGVLLIGDSGIGKSETTFELVRNNHLFVADDRVSISLINGRLIGKAIPMIKNMIELRGIGILNMTHISGHHGVLQESTIDIVINLCFSSDKCTIGITDSYDIRIGESSTAVKMYTIPVTSGRNVSHLIELAVIHAQLNDKGITPEEIDNKVIKFLQKK